MRYYCPEIFRSPGFDVRHPRTPPPYFGFKLKIFLYQIASIFYMYIDMGEMIADKQDRPSLIIEDPQGPKNSPKYKYLYILPHI